MKQKMVRYVGGEDSNYPCADPKVLVKGAVYEVIATREGAFQTTYSLNGLKGWFDAKWFTQVVPSFNGIHLAVTNETLAIGKSCSCQLVVYHDENWELNPWTTSPIEKIKRICKNIWIVKAYRTVYVVLSESSEKMGMMVTQEIPAVRKCCTGYKIVPAADAKWKFDQWSTAPVQNIKFIGGEIYMVQDEMAVYVVQVG